MIATPLELESFWLNIKRTNQKNKAKKKDRPFLIILDGLGIILERNESAEDKEKKRKELYYRGGPF
jgi:hypothetical protein